MIGELVLAIEALAPCRLAAEWDKVGLLVGDAARPLKRALLCIDLTEETLSEAIAHKCEAVIAYHPPIFEPIARITSYQPRGALLMRCIEHRVALISPHTALDAVQGGVTDWLADMLGEGKRWPIEAAMMPTSASAHSREGTAVPTPHDHAKSDVKQGHGRIVQLQRALTHSAIALRLRRALKIPAHGLQLVQSRHARSHRRIGVVPGAGCSLLHQAADQGCTLFITGEARHHDQLAAKAWGCDLMLAGHTQTERGYLPTLAKNLAPHLLNVKLLVSTSDTPPNRAM